MTVISRDELRTVVEWSRNNGTAVQDKSGGVRFEHQGKTYLVPAELLTSEGEEKQEDVDLSGYAVSKP